MNVLDEIKIYDCVPPTFHENDSVSIDIELFGAEETKLHRPTGKFASIALTANGKDVYVVTDKEWLRDIAYTIKNCELVFQNAMFDIFQLRRWIKLPKRLKVWDTMLVDRVMFNGYYDAFNLRALTRRHLGLLMEKDALEQFKTATEMNREMIEYNARDTVAAWWIAQHQKKIIKEPELKVWNEIDMPAMWAFLDFKGFRVDVKKWEETAIQNKAQAELLKSSFSFNPASWQQVKKYFKEQLKINLPSTDEEELTKWDEAGFTDAGRIIQFRKIAKRASTYGMNWIEEHIEPDGCVYSSYDINRAESGRTASSHPNIQNIPIRETPVFRECFIPKEGNQFVIADYGQQEVRIIAYLSQDKNLIKLFEKGGDVYTNVMEKMGTEYDRSQVKSLVLGLCYGLSPSGLAREASLDKEEAEMLFEDFFKMFPGVKSYIQTQRQAGNFVRTPAGRKCWLNHYNQQWERNALNSPAQGGAADMGKIALAHLHDFYGSENYPVVAFIHDEIILDIPIEKVEEAKKVLEECTIEAGEQVIPGVPIAVDIRVGKSWAKE